MTYVFRKNPADYGNSEQRVTQPEADGASQRQADQQGIQKTLMVRQQQPSPGRRNPFRSRAGGARYLQPDRKDHSQNYLKEQPDPVSAATALSQRQGFGQARRRRRFELSYRPRFFRTVSRVLVDHHRLGLLAVSMGSCDCTQANVRQVLTFVPLLLWDMLKKAT